MAGTLRSRKRRDISSAADEVSADSFPTVSHTLDMDSPSSDMEIYAKEVLNNLIADNIPPTPSNFSLYFDRLLENKSESLRKQIVSILGLEEYLERKPKQLSGGQRQRVAVGRAIVRKPKVFLFDEPLSNLDAKMRVQMRAEISKLHTTLQATMLYVTHDQVEAMTMGDRIVVMKDGFIQQIADPIQLYDYPENKFVAGFIGSPPMNFMDCKVVSEKGAIWVDAKSFKVKVTDEQAKHLQKYIGKEVAFGVRPEHIEDINNVTDADPSTCIRALVDVIEPMGAETFLYLTSGQHSFIAKIGGHEQSRVGDSIDLALSIERAHYFDSETEKVII